MADRGCPGYHLIELPTASLNSDGLVLGVWWRAARLGKLSHECGVH